MTTLELTTQPGAPLEAASITPDNFLGKNLAEICRLPVIYGNEAARLGDFFKVDGCGSAEIILNGNLSRVKNIAAGMTQGKVTVNGEAGMHLGAGMSGGEIHVFGSSADWAGAEMSGGKIHIRGNAGHGLGGAYRGSRRGMNRGLIIVEGSAGNEVGSTMRRGLIIVTGDVGDFAGAFMIAGTIVVFGKMGIRAGAGLLRGTIIALHQPELLPTYRYACSCRPSFIDLLLNEIERHGLSAGQSFAAGFFRRYCGDFNRLGKGEILVYDQR